MTKLCGEDYIMLAHASDAIRQISGTHTALLHEQLCKNLAVFTTLNSAKKKRVQLTTYQPERDNGKIYFLGLLVFKEKGGRAAISKFLD
jgi:hypothetical protein